MTLSFARRVKEGANKPQLLMHVLRRAVIIFGLGLFLNGFPFGLVSTHDFSWAAIRIPGVLQRIAICYLIASTIFLYTDVRGQILWIIGCLDPIGLRSRSSLCRGSEQGAGTERQPLLVHRLASAGGTYVEGSSSARI